VRRPQGLFARPVHSVRSDRTEPIRLVPRTGSVIAQAVTSRRLRETAPRKAVPNVFAHLSDEALVALVARSDDEAFAELYDRYDRLAYGLARRILRDGTLAEDAVQDAFLTIWRSAARFNAERAPARVWILTLVHRRAVDLVRHHEKRRTEQLPQREEKGDDGADETVWLRLQRDRVRDALGQLPDQQREAIELAYFGGFTQSELAERLGQPLGTIKSRMFSGLARLRELLDDATPEGDPWSGTTFTS
jgi:RNA polymerase sigma factor (sigma-70 family)